jgi:hypothetical protein
MSPDRIKQTLDAKPFQPFTVVCGDGGTVDVVSREFAYLLPGGRTLLVSVPKHARAKNEGEFEEHRIDVFLITRLISPVQRKSGRRRSA